MRERPGNPDSNEDGHFGTAPRDQDTVETVLERPLHTQFLFPFAVLTIRFLSDPNNPVSTDFVYRLSPFSTNNLI